MNSEVIFNYYGYFDLHRSALSELLASAKHKRVLRSKKDNKDNFVLASDYLSYCIIESIAAGQFTATDKANLDDYENLRALIVKFRQNNKNNLETIDKALDVFDKQYKQAFPAEFNSKYASKKTCEQKKTGFFSGIKSLFLKQKQEAPKQEAPKQEAAKQEAAKQEAAKQEAAKQEAAKQEAPKQENTSKKKQLLRIIATSSVVLGTALLVLNTGFLDFQQKKAFKKSFTVRERGTASKYNANNCAYCNQLDLSRIVGRTQQTQQQSEEMKNINAYCENALNIIIGEQAYLELYKKIKHQVLHKRFKIPEGMSIERIAHAATMSRIYEGKSIVLDALETKVNLTPDQQKMFESHIESIGVRGEKLQKRMSEKQTLSKHSRFDKASHSAQQKHVKNLQKLIAKRAVNAR